LADVRVSTGITNLDLVASSPSLAGAEVELVDVPERETILKRSLDGAVSEYGYVFIDCPPSLGLLTLNALVAADSVLIPLQCEYYALEGLSHLLETLSRVQHGLNPNLEIEGVLLTMFDSRLNLSTQVADEARRHFGERVYETMIPRNVRLGEAPSFGKPIIEYDPHCVGASSYIHLAKEMLENVR
jgi:chromosome partitioning protein